MSPLLQNLDGGRLTSSGEVVRADLELICERASDAFAKMAGSSLLIVGGAGFLGYYLVQAVLHWNDLYPKRSISLTVFDNWSRGKPTWLTAFEADPCLELVTFDIREPLPEGMRDYEWVIHAASIASPTYYRQHPIETMDANVTGLRNLLEYARRQADRARPLQGFLFYSTSEIYGDPTPDAIPTPETYRGNVSCTGPRACYDESKRYGETLCVNFAEIHRVPVRIARPFNNYGPGMKITDRRVIADFARDILANRNVVMLSSGTPTRTFCYVADAVVGYFKLLAFGRDGEAYNIGTPSPEISMSQLAQMMTALARDRLGYSGRVVYDSSDDPAYLVDNPNRRCPVIDKARNELGFCPVVDIEDGLWRSLLWYRDHQEAEDS